MSSAVSTFFQSAVAVALMIGCFAAGYFLGRAENASQPQIQASPTQVSPAPLVIPASKDKVACLDWVSANFDKPTVFTFSAICGDAGAPR
jgi:hypothetical protein